MSNALLLRTGAWYGDVEQRFPCPDSWTIHYLRQNDATALKQEQIQTAFEHPIDSPKIRELARGKRTAAIIVDDLSRPTPVHDLVPYVLQELRDAGIPNEGIRFVIGGGSHRPLTKEEMGLKLGPDIVGRYCVESHDFFAGDLQGFGCLENGTPIYINRTVADADLKLCVGGVYPHESVGFGGGAKLIVPGVAGFATMFYFHHFHPSRGHAVIEGSPDIFDHRDCLEAIAERIGLRVVVNAVINSRREIAGVFVGDFRAAHRTAARFALQVYGTPIPTRLRSEADIVIMNLYPLDSDPIQLGKGLWPRRYFPKARTIAMDAATDGIGFHGLFDRLDYRHYQEQRKAAKHEAHQDPTSLPPSGLLVWSEHFDADEFRRKQNNAALYRSWESLTKALRVELPAANVVVFPCSSIQISEDADAHG